MKTLFKFPLALSPERTPQKATETVECKQKEF